MSSPTVIVNSTPVVKVSYGLPGIGVPSGGVKPQVLKKSSSADYATEWGDVEVLMLDRTDLTFTGTLSKGDPVYINSSGQIAACDAADAATLPPVGLVAGNVTDPADDVDVILVGALIDANTATFSVGDRLYVAAGGGITATAPSGTDASYSVGVVSKVDSTEGIISVYVDGSNNTFEGLAQNQIWVGNANGVATQYTHQLSTLIDVDPSMSPSSGDFFRYSGTQWEASSSPITFADITGLDHLPQGHVYVGDSSNLTSTTDTIYVDVANSRVGIGTTTPQEALHVEGRINLSEGGVNQKYILIGTELPNSLFNGAVGIGERVFQNSTASNFSVAIGKEAGQNAGGNRNVAIGQRAIRGASGSTGSYNVAVGAQSMINLTDGDYNIAVGQSAAQALTSGEYNVALGSYAGYQSTTASKSTYVGAQSGYSASGGNNVAVGYNAIKGTSGQSTFENTVAVGYEALTALTTGAENTAIGYEALHDLTTGSRNTVLGYQAGNDLTIQGGNTLIGSRSSGFVGSVAIGDTSSASGAAAISIGSLASASATGALSIGLSSQAASSGSIAIGYYSRAHERGVFIGSSAGLHNNGEGNTVIGYEAGVGNNTQQGSTYNYNVLLGYRAGFNLEQGSGNVFIGYGAGKDIELESNRLHISGQAQFANGALPLIYGEFDNEFVKINGDLEVRDDIVSSNNEDITIIPNGTGHVLLGNYEFDTNQTLAPALDRYVLTYDGNTQEISLQENPALEGEIDVNLVVETVKNGNAGTLNKGTVVYITGEDLDGNTTVDVANNTDETKMPAVFVLNEDIAAGATGQAVFSGLLDAVNTAGFSVGDVVYVGDNGNFVSERPESPNVIQEIAIVANVSATDGKVYVSKDVKEDPEKIHFPIRNDEGAVIPAGTPIYSKGEIGGSERILVGIADASDPAKMPAIGIATTQLTTTGADQDGLAIMVGTYNTNISGFTGLADNDVLYVASGGGLTKDKPTGTNLIQNVGIVLKTNGTICQGLKVSCIGRTNDVPNIPEGNIWAGNADGTAVATDTAYVDIANSRVGIGTTSPTSNLHVVGSTHAQGVLKSSFGLQGTSADMALLNTANGSGYIRFMTTTGSSIERMRIVNNGDVGIGTNAPDEKLHVLGQIKIDDGSNPYTLPAADGAASGYILETDGAGTVSWVANSGGSDTNIANTNLTLDANRTLDLKDGASNYTFDITKDTASLFKITSASGPYGDNKIEIGSTVLNIDSATTIENTLTVKGSAVSLPGEIRFNEASNNGALHTGFKSPDLLTSSSVYTMPTYYPDTTGKVLSSTDAGVLSWVDQPSGDNLGNTNLTQSAQNRTYTTAGGYDLEIKTTQGVGIVWDDVNDPGSTNLDNIIVKANEGRFVVGALANDQVGSIRLLESVNAGNVPRNHITVKVPDSITNNVTLTLPNGNGDSGQVLQTDGSGVLSWVNQTEIPALNVTQVSGSGALGRVPFYSSNTTTLDSSADFSFSSGVLSVPRVTQDKIVQVKPSAASAAGSFGANSETVSKHGANVSVTAGKVYGMTSGSFAVTDAEVEANSKGMLAVASATGTTNGTDMVLKGFVKLSTNSAFSSANVGDPVYLRGADGSQANKGTLTATPPSATGDIVRIVGYVSDAANGIVYFNPDNSYIEV